MKIAPDAKRVMELFNEQIMDVWYEESGVPQRDAKGDYIRRWPGMIERGLPDFDYATYVREGIKKDWVRKDDHTLYVFFGVPWKVQRKECVPELVKLLDHPEKKVRWWAVLCLTHTVENQDRPQWPEYENREEEELAKWRKWWKEKGADYMAKPAASGIVPAGEQSRAAEAAGPGYRLWRLPRGPQEQVPALVRFQEVVGEGQWHYTWPEGRLPGKIDGYKLVASPVEGSMAGWARPVVFESANTGARVSVRCFKDYAGVKIAKPWIDPDWPPRWLEVVEFHGLKAGMVAIVPTGFAPLLPGARAAVAVKGVDPTPVTSVKFDEHRKVEFVFRLGDNVFGIHAEDKASVENAWTAAKEVGEAVYSHQRQATSR